MNSDSAIENIQENAESAENTHIQMIMSQCKIDLQQAIELYTKFNGDVVGIIAHQLDPSYKEPHTKNDKKTELQRKFDTIRNIANQKDSMFTQYLNAQKQSTQTTQQPETHLPTDDTGRLEKETTT